MHHLPLLHTFPLSLSSLPPYFSLSLSPFSLSPSPSLSTPPLPRWLWVLYHSHSTRYPQHQMCHMETSRIPQATILMYASQFTLGEPGVDRYICPLEKFLGPLDKLRLHPPSISPPPHSSLTDCYKLCISFVFCPAFFLGGSPQVTVESLIHSSQDRQHLRTEAMGTVHLRLGVILRHFDKFGVEFN